MDYQQEKKLKDFELLKQLVLVKKPVLAYILKKHGQNSWCDYANDYLEVNMNDIVLSRQEEFLNVFGEEVERVLGKEISDSAVKQLRKYYFVSTADHHGPICHPFFLNPNMVTATTLVGNPDPVLKNVIVLSCANVSMANSSFPRGLLLTGANAGKTKSWELPLFPRDVRGSRVFNFSSYGIEAVKKVKQRMGELVRLNETSKSVADKVNEVMDQIYTKPEILSCENYSDQITKTNFDLWKKMFHSPDEETSNLLYIEIERVVNLLISKNHLYHDTIINKFFFKKEWRDEFIKNFNGLFCGFDLEKKIGSMFFWALPPGSKYCLQLWLEGDYLQSQDGSYKILFTPEEVEKAIERKELIPSGLLALLLLSLYYGLKCLGGFSQVNYLTDFKKAYIKTMLNLGEVAEAEACEDRQTKELGEGGTVAYIEDKENKLFLASGLDLVVYGDQQTWRTLIDISKSISVEEALNMMMPDFYLVAYPEAERIPDLLAISSDDIIGLTGVREKIKPCISLSY